MPVALEVDYYIVLPPGQRRAQRVLQHGKLSGSRGSLIPDYSSTMGIMLDDFSKPLFDSYIDSGMRISRPQLA
jgi:hypothetical protein